MRLYPTDLNEAEFNSRMSILCQEIIGTKNIKKIKSDLFRSLLNRNDYLSSIELYSISDAIYRLKNPSNVPWFNDLGRTIIQFNDIAISSKIYEMISASMFCEHHNVELSDVSQPGYDFTIHNDDLSIRVSCKKLLRSDEHRQFIIDCDKLHERLINRSACHGKNAYQFNLISNATYNSKSSEIHTVGNHVEEIFRGFENSNNHKFLCGSRNTMAAILPLNVWTDGWLFSKDDISAVTRVSYSFSASEQTRFENLFRRAAKNLKKHTKNATNTSINMIMIGLPEYVSLAIAEKWVNSKFINDYSSIALVLLHRSVPCRDPKNPSDTVISNEFKFIINQQYPNLSVELLKSMKLNITVPFGTISFSDSTMVFMDENGNSLTIDGCFVYQKGIVHLVRPLAEGNYSIPGHYGIEVKAKVFTGNKYHPLPLPERPMPESFVYL